MTIMTDDPHIAMIRAVEPSVVGACEDCVRLGTPWLHLRMCLTCGHMGCCDSSPMRHARQHALAHQHPIVRSAEPGENWRWCYFHEAFV
jgi:hypothetical protein